ncbi:MAG: sugar phosphate isomerase/epimerase [Deltaproteobacteria bacterium]|nr:sugar phosphate isomerase/epimerase [Deltaproteobacteria bacterium]
MLYGAMNFPISPILEELEAISGLGFDYLELAMDPPQAHYKSIHQHKEELLSALDHSNMGLVCHLPTFVSTADLTDTLRETSLNEVLESLDVTAELRPLKVVLHPSIMRGLSIFVMDQARRYALKSLEVIVKKAAHLGLCLCIENMFPRSHSLVDPEDFDEIFERFPKLKLTLDIGHAYIDVKGSRKTLSFIGRFPDPIAHIHANDNLGKDDDHLPIGAGTIDFPEIVGALKAIGYDQTITLEVFSRDRDYLKISRDKLAAMVAGS